MKNFGNNKTVNFEKIEESGIYSQELLKQLKVGNYSYLSSELSGEQRNNKDFMEPLLYAVRNEKKTYMVYKYYGANLQENLGLLIEVVSHEPSIIEGTPISRNKELMLDVAEIRPSVIMYVDENLKLDPEFIEELHDMKDKGIEAALALIANPELSHNFEFMKEAIKEDSNFLENASEELKNNYEFIKEVTKEKYETVEYVIKNRDNFGLEGIKGAKETTRELTIEDYMDIINEMSENSDDERYKRVKNKVEEKGANDPRAVKWITAMAAQNKENISIDNFKKVFDNAILTMTKIQKDLTENGEIKILRENAHELITPRILNELKEAAIEKGLEITQEQEDRFKEYEEFQKEYNEKLTEKKKQDRQKEEKDNIKITPQEIEEKAEDVKTSEINEATKEIR